MDCDDLQEIKCDILSEQMTSVVSTLENIDNEPTSTTVTNEIRKKIENTDRTKDSALDKELPMECDGHSGVDSKEKKEFNVTDTCHLNLEKPMEESDNVADTSSPHDNDGISTLGDNDLEQTEENIQHGVEDTISEKFSNVQIKVIDVPDDDDLFDYLNKDVDNEIGTEITDIPSDDENTREIRKGELYRYLTANDPLHVSSRSNEVTPYQTPYQSGNESDSSDENSDVVYLSTDIDSDQDQSVTLDHSLQSSRCQTPVQEEEIKEVRRKPGRKPRLNKRTELKDDPVQLSEKTRERLEKCKMATNKWLKDLELPKNLSLDEPLKFQIYDLNQYLTCGLCKGYLYEASTITECMHTFCKNCIVRHCMEVSLHCPVCNILIHPTDPFVHIRLDRMIQDIVYKILPSVAHTEFQNIKDFYAAHPEIVEPQEISEPPVEPEESPPKPDVVVPQPHMVSVLLEPQSKSVDEELEKRFIRVVSRATIDNVCTFLKSKLELMNNKQVSVYCGSTQLEDPTCTLENIQSMYYTEEDPLLLLQYRITDDAIS